MLLGRERRQWRVMVPLRPWQLCLAPCPGLCHSVFFLLRGSTKGSWGRGSSESSSLVSPARGASQSLHTRLPPHRESSCVMEATRPS